MDQPISMYTLDYCIEQDVEWPIFFSPLVDWPTLEQQQAASARGMLHDPDLPYTPYVLQPDSALLFCGSSQWHYREAMTAGSFCNLLFLHYFPAGCEDLVRPEGWARHFALPELEALVDLLAEADPASY
jgi:hypothetical protein